MHCESRRGFTLVELLVVIAILGIISATAAVRLSGVMQGARLQWAISQIKSADQNARSHAAARGKPTVLVINLDRAKLQPRWGVSEKEARGIAIGQGIALTRFKTATRVSHSGEVTVTYSPQGASETFAIEVSGRAQPKWLLFAGRTGQVTEIEGEAAINDIFEAISSRGADAR